MNKAGLAAKSGNAGWASEGRGRIALAIIGLIGFASLALAGPSASQAAEYFEHNTGGTWATPGAHIDLGAIKTGTTFDKQFRMRSNSFVGSNTQRTGRFTFSDANFSYISNCSGTSYSWTNETLYGFTMGKRHARFSSSFDCAFTARLKNTVSPGHHETTLTWENAGNWTGPGSTVIRYTVADPTLTITGPDGDPSPLDFGDVAVGDSASRTLTVSNTSPFPLTGMTRVLTGSADISITNTTCAATLGPDSDCNVTVRYQPSGVSAASGTLAVGSGSGHSGSFIFEGNGVPAVADLSVDPASFDYGGVVHGFPAGHAFTVANTGNTTLALDFDLTGGTDPAVVFRNGGTCGANLGVGLSCTMVVFFDPENTGPASQTGGFTVTGSSSLVPLPVSQTVDVTATRVAPESSYETWLSGGDEIDRLDFGVVDLDSTSSRTIEIRNTGNIPIPNLVPSLTGPEASSYSISGNTCGTAIPRDQSCSFTVTVNADRGAIRRATLVLTPATMSPSPGIQRLPLTADPAGIQIRNNQGDDVQAITPQKRWLETLTVNPAGSTAADIVRVAFEVDAGVATDIDGVEIAGSTTTNDSAPGAGYQNIEDLLGGTVHVERKPGSSQALVTASIQLSSTAMGTGNGQYGFSNGTDVYLGCVGGSYQTDNRRLWFRVRGADGSLTPPVGSVIRFVNQNYTCPENQGPGMMGQRILSVGGVNQPGGTIHAVAPKNAPAVFQFTTRAKSAPLLGGDPGWVDAIRVRIRNAKTGKMFRPVDGVYQPCDAPCTSDSWFNTGGARIPLQREAGQRSIEIPGIPSRGRWIVEGSLQGTNEDDNRFYHLGTLRINDKDPASPTMTFGGTLTDRPDTDENYTISANVSDPADPVNPLDSQGGKVQVIEWDLDGDTTNGPLGDGFEFRSEGDSTTGVPPFDLTQAFSTVGKTPGPYKIRARITDNGSLLASEAVAESRIFEFVTTINSPPQPVNDVVYLEADQDQPADIEFRATDENNDQFKVAITPDSANSNTLEGDLNGPIGDNTKQYRWGATYTGTDAFRFVPTDDHKGTGPEGTLTVRVRPDTTIDNSTIPGTLHHPDVSDPAKRFLGSTTTTDASFEFSSPQSPVVAFECRHLLDGDVVADWDECSNQSTGDIDLTDLADGMHRLEVRAINDEGVEDGTPAFRTWRVDNTAPVTEVRVGPHSNRPQDQPRYTKVTTPTYILRATSEERSLQQYMTYECRVMWGPEAGNWKPCGAPSDTQGSGPIDLVNGIAPDFGITEPLPEGDYEIQARATDEVGNLGPVMIELLRVDTTPPDTALASGPEGLVNTRTLEYVLGSSQGRSTFLCEVEGETTGIVVPMGPCPGPAADGSRPTFTVPADDKYTLKAIAVDPANNADPTPLVVEFEVDATEPETVMDPEVDYGDGPTTARRTRSRKVDVTFTGSDLRKLQGFQCRLDSNDEDDWQICESPQRFSGLSDGPHRLEIRAKDEALNYDSTPEILEWVVDRTPPVTSFTEGPDPVTNVASPAFRFEVNEAVSRSQCRLDGEAPVDCTSPFTLDDLGHAGGVPDGMHHVTVRSTDLAGNVEATAASISWRQDTVDPVVTFTSKPAAFTPLGAVDFGWSVKDGNPPVLAPEAAAECALDPVDADAIDAGEWVDCGRELTVGEADNTNGPHSLSVRAVDEAGNVSAVARHDWVVLGSKPNPPMIDDSSPTANAVTRVGTAYFAISHELDGTGALDTLLCSLDGGTRTPCEGNYSAEGLDDGPHTFAVFARDIAGNVSEPAELNWEVQRGAPVTTIDFGAHGLTKETSATFKFSSDKAGTFECRIDGGLWEICESPVELTGLSDGEHSFLVRAVSTVVPVGVKDPTPAKRQWTVDTEAPEVEIRSGPSDRVVSYDATLTFSSNDSEAGFQCKLNDGLYSSCGSPWRLDDLKAGEQTVTIRAIDPAGNVSEAPATWTWVVEDPTCPDGFEGTPPDCTELQPVRGIPLKAVSTSGTLALASLGSVDLPADQIKLDGRLGDDGRWFVPASGVAFAPVTQVLEDVLGPGTSATVVISISATADAWGVLPKGGGPARIKLPVRADVEAKLGNISLLPPGTECSLRPVTFNLVGTFDDKNMTAHLEQPDVSFPKVTGCATFKETIDSLLELPRQDIELAVDLAFTPGTDSCPDGMAGTPPDCAPVETPSIKLAKPVVNGTKQIRSGKKIRFQVKLKNLGTAPAENVRVCLTAPRRYVKGKATKCRAVRSVAPGKVNKTAFRFKAKRFKAAKVRPVTIKGVATYADTSGKTRKVVGKYKATVRKSGRAR